MEPLATPHLRSIPAAWLGPHGSPVTLAAPLAWAALLIGILPFLASYTRPGVSSRPLLPPGEPSGGCSQRGLDVGLQPGRPPGG